MVDALVLLVVGFLLTTVLGGFLGSYFQTRTWTQRYAAERRDERHRQAMATFEQLSTLMDRRLYRMKRVWWLISRSIDEGSKPGPRLRT